MLREVNTRLTGNLEALAVEATTTSMGRIHRAGLRAAERDRVEPPPGADADVIAKFNSQPPTLCIFCSGECESHFPNSASISDCKECFRSSFLSENNN